MKEIQDDVQISCGIGLFMTKTYLCAYNKEYRADLPTLVEHKALKLVVMGSSPMVGAD